MNTGWKQIEGKWYLFDSKGNKITGWQRWKGKWYFMHPSGEMAFSQWIQEKGKWYYLHRDGSMAVSEWVQGKDGKYYFLRSNGEMAQFQMREWKGKSYYLGRDGAMVTGTDVTWKGKVYYANEKGVCIEKRLFTELVQPTAERKKIIWNFLTREMGLDSIHAAAIMGNLWQESGFSPINAQGYKGLDNVEYLADFSSEDRVGWGIAQWTFSVRKQALKDFADQRGVSVGDLKMQLEFLRRELEKGPYKKAYALFLNSGDLSEAVEIFCREIERPGVPLMEKRIAYAEKILEEFGLLPG